VLKVNELGVHFSRFYCFRTGLDQTVATSSVEGRTAADLL